MKKTILLGTIAYVIGCCGFYLVYCLYTWLKVERPDYSWVPSIPIHVTEQLSASPLASIGRTNFYKATIPTLNEVFYGSKSTTTLPRKIQRSELHQNGITSAPTRKTFYPEALALDVPMHDLPALASANRIGSFSGAITSLVLWGAMGPPQVAQAKPNVAATIPVQETPQQQTPPEKLRPDQQPVTPKLTNPVVAVQMALADAASLPPAVAQQRRYLWCPNASNDEYVAAAFTINSALSHSSIDIIPIRVANGNLIAVDLKLCAPADDIYKKLSSVWEKYAQEEPYFHVPGRFKQSVKPYKSQDGKTYDYEWRDGYVRAPYLGQAIIDLETATGSYCPILRVDQWIVRSLDTVDSGLYYDLRGLEVGKTKLDEYLVSRGASREQAKRTRADEKAIFMSEVTDKARVVTMFPTASTRLSVGLGMAAITDDPFDETDQAEFDPFRNFLESKTNGHEVFVTLPSGWIEYTIWDADGNLVKEAPPNLVADHRIPEPHTRRLQGAISCIRCHASNDMWQPFTNEVAAMISNQGANVFGDLKGGKKQDDTLQRLAGLYSGDLTEVLTLARNAFARRVFAVCRMEAADAAGAVAKVYNEYVYTRVTAKTACREVGIVVPEDDTLGVQTLRAHVPPLPLLDDPVIGRLQVSFLDINRKTQRGLTLTRRQWEQVFADFYIRKLANEQKTDQSQ